MSRRNNKNSNDKAAPPGGHQSERERSSSRNAQSHLYQPQTARGSMSSTRNEQPSSSSDKNPFILSQGSRAWPDRVPTDSAPLSPMSSAIQNIRCRRLTVQNPRTFPSRNGAGRAGQSHLRSQENPLNKRSLLPRSVGQNGQRKRAHLDLRSHRAPHTLIQPSQNGRAASSTSWKEVLVVGNFCGLALDLAAEVAKYNQLKVDGLRAVEDHIRMVWDKWKTQSITRKQLFHSIARYVRSSCHEAAELDVIDIFKRWLEQQVLDSIQSRN